MIAVKKGGCLCVRWWMNVVAMLKRLGNPRHKVPHHMLALRLKSTPKVGTDIQITDLGRSLSLSLVNRYII